jgi:hypothetical protein
LTTPHEISASCSDLARSVSDALLLCEALGIQYLWVDTLCIVQDDPSDVARHYKTTHMIYQGAMLTVVSAAGIDANGGLPGMSSARPVRQHTAVVHGMQMVTTLRPFASALKDSKWESRGWTFQEKVLSNRLLILLSTKFSGTATPLSGWRIRVWKIATRI